ncbi:MAG TPA: sigma-54 dependent transcriptional regulator [Myxococcales bacterium]|nr:sigma-54 dependent transcriptional regulator [Myxococcales bacterium]
MTPRAHIFLLDDDDLTTGVLARVLETAGYEVLARSDPAGAVDEIQAFAADLVLLGLEPSGATAFRILSELAERGIDSQAVIVSSDSSAESAVRAMKAGAVDYLTKPFDVEQAKLAIGAIVEKGQIRQELEYLRRISGSELAHREIVGSSPAVRTVRAGIEKLAKAGVTMMLVTGESGTGKELVARHLHHLLHGETGGRLAPFIGVNCAALPETLIESELFGHEKGAFTDARAEKKGVFEIASGGTILLDEIGEMDWHLQAKLLRVLEERSFRRLGGRAVIPVRATVIATTNCDLDAAMKAGEFRTDLFYRLATFSLHIPPLRERADDVLELSRHFLDCFAAKYRRPPLAGLSDDAARLLLAYPWPGNVRELRNVMERIVVLESGGEVLPEHLPKEILYLRAGAEPAMADAGAAVLPEEGLSLDALERSLIEQALVRARGNKTIAARLLGISYDSLRYQAKKLGLGNGQRGPGAEEWAPPG